MYRSASPEDVFGAVLQRAVDTKIRILQLFVRQLTNLSNFSSDSLAVRIGPCLGVVTNSSYDMSYR